MNNKTKDYTYLINQRFGRLIVLKVYRIQNPNRKNRSMAMCSCECDCGNIKEYEISKITSHNTKSCGCLQKDRASESNSKHGQSKTPTHKSWTQMFTRCYNKNDPAYKYYGEKGIEVCDRWKDFNNFFNDMGERPSKNYSLDRIDVKGDYEPSNCRWVVQTIQVINRNIQKSNTSGFEGVSYNKLSKKWGASIRIMGDRLNLGYYKDIEDAIKIRKEYEILRLSILSEMGLI